MVPEIVKVCATDEKFTVALAPFTVTGVLAGVKT
jgi:hypothetical protein